MILHHSIRMVQKAQLCTDNGTDSHNEHTIEATSDYDCIDCQSDN